LCEPTTIAFGTTTYAALATGLKIAATAISLGSSIYGMVASHQSAEQSYDFAKQRNDTVTNIARSNTVANQKLIRTRQNQNTEAAIKEKIEGSREARRLADTARVSAGEAGLGGNSIERINRNFLKQEAEYGFGIDRNLQIANNQLEFDLEQEGRNYSNTLLGLPQLQKPSSFGLGLGITGVVADAIPKIREAFKTEPQTETAPA
jgi:hypothetical protein